MRTGLDTNVISALWSRQPEAPQVEVILLKARSSGALVICGPVYAELVAHPDATFDFVDRFLVEARITIDFDLGEPVWREAARGFADYAKRRRDSSGGQPKRFLADFAVGAHALLKADRLFTLDRNRYVRDFPNLRLFQH